jgi:ubiquinone/menaquinone biosynthesis C-methylase UbiE
LHRCDRNGAIRTMALVQFALCAVIGRVPTEGSNPRVCACDEMGFYQDQIVPSLINWSMRQKNLAAYRARIIPAAEGRVLEIGIGSGLNLPFYSRNVARIIGLEPSPRLLAMARRVERNGSNGSVEFIEGSAEAIPLQDANVDTVVTTWTLCSIPDALRALRDMRRVLRPGGRLLFVEHGRAPDPIIWWQDRLIPAWKRLAGGCHLNRAIGTLIEGAGFRFDRLETGYMRGPKPMTFMYEGSARLR